MSTSEWIRVPGTRKSISKIITKGLDGSVLAEQFEKNKELIIKEEIH